MGNMIIDEKGRQWTVQDDEDWLYGIVTNRARAEEHWDDMRVIDRARGHHVQPGLEWLCCINDREQLINSELWPMLSDKLKVWLIVVDDADIETVTREAVHDIARVDA